jgi:hypothetical protein
MVERVRRFVSDWFERRATKPTKMYARGGIVKKKGLGL